MNPGGGAGGGPSPASATAAPGGVVRSLSSSSSSASAAALSSSLQQVAEDNLFAHLADDLTFTHDGKLETQRALMEELLESLRKEEKLLDADAWKYTAPRSQLHLTSLSGLTLYSSYQEPRLRVNKRKRPYHTGSAFHSLAIK